MKNKILAGIAVAVACVGLAIAGEQYIDYLKTDVTIVMRRLGIGTMSPSSSYIVDVRGNSRQVGMVVVSTSVNSSSSLALRGAVVTLSTRPATVGEVWRQTSDNTLWMSTAVPAHNSAVYGGTAAYIKLSN
jgi:hypothetical protein